MGPGVDKWITRPVEAFGGLNWGRSMGPGIIS